MKRAQPSIALALALCACDGPIADIDSGFDGGTDAARPSFVAPELADEAALARWAEAYTSLPVLESGALRQVSSEDRGRTSSDVVLLQNGNRDMNHFVCLGSEAELHDPYLEELLFDEPSCAEPYARGAVIARFVGSGVLVRLWSTLISIRTQPADRERLLVWVDDDPEPVVDVPLDDALRGSADEMFAPPFGAGAGDRLAWYYPVVFASKLLIALDGLGPLDLVYHETTVRMDDAPRARAPARLAARDAAIRALAMGDDTATETLRSSVVIAPGETIDAFDLTGPSTIHALGVRVADPAALDGVDLEIRWDDAVDPAIAVPLRELFAASIDPPMPEGPILRAERDATGWTMRLALPMPFATRAQIALTSSRSTELELFVERAPGIPDRAYGRLHVQRSETLGPTDAPQHPIASASVRGRLVGVCAMMEGRALETAGVLRDPLNFLEGDENIVLDAVELRGTGTEDYFDGAFYFGSGPFATPFAQAFGARALDDTTGVATACRWHIGLGGLDFATSLDADLEIGPGAPSTLDRYRTIAFLYL